MSAIAEPLATTGRYTLHLATEPEQVKAAQRLRFEVFNLEMGEGLASSTATGFDEDEFDAVCTHLLVIETVSGKVVGTYRMQTGANAGERIGYYSAREFDFEPFEQARDEIVELGRACVSVAHRNQSVLGLLWKGIARYAQSQQARYLVGCSSLTSRDPARGVAAYGQLAGRHLAPPEWRTLPLPAWRCQSQGEAVEAVPVPRLMSAYLAAGAKICGEPAIDREFGTIDFLTWMDLQTMPRPSFAQVHGVTLPGFMVKSWEFVRGLGRLIALLAVILGAGFAYAVNRNNRRDTAAKARWLQRTCRRCLGTLAVSIESRGTPARGAVIVSNHLSYIDILIFGALTPVVFVSKKEVRRWPIFGWFAEKAGTRFIDRNKRGDVRRISEEIGPVMRDGLTVVLFLEGTTTDGAGVLPFKSSLLEPAVANGWTIVPAAVGYSVPSGRSVRQEVCWWGDMALTPHLRNFTTLPWVRANVVWGDSLMAGGERKPLAELLHEKVVSLKAELPSGENRVVNCSVNIG